MTEVLNPTDRAFTATEGRERRFIAATRRDLLGTRSVELGWYRGETVERELSRDSTSGAISTVFSLLAGDGPEGAFASSIELFVIDGSLSVGENELTKYSYMTVPAGHRAGPFRSESGCTVALFSWGPADFGPHVEAAPGTPQIPLVEAVNCYEIPWTDTVENLPNRLPPGLFVKPLMQDLETGAITFLSGSIMRWMSADRWEVHPTFEEQLYLEGEFLQLEVLDSGRRQLDFSGAGYSFRPSGVYHLGPGSGTDSYCLRVVRVPSLLVNEYLQNPEPYPSQYLPPTVLEPSDTSRIG